jgi:hypothetical protein
MSLFVPCVLMLRFAESDSRRYAANFAAYPRKWSLNAPNTNIDHRRVPNQMKFFERHGIIVPLQVNSSTRSTWQPGDIVCWNTGRAAPTPASSQMATHASGLPLVIHKTTACAWKTTASHVADHRTLSFSENDTEIRRAHRKIEFMYGMSTGNVSIKQL